MSQNGNLCSSHKKAWTERQETGCEVWHIRGFLSCNFNWRNCRHPSRRSVWWRRSVDAIEGDERNTWSLEEDGLNTWKMLWQQKGVSLLSRTCVCCIISLSGRWHYPVTEMTSLRKEWQQTWRSWMLSWSRTLRQRFSQRLVQRMLEVKPVRETICTASSNGAREAKKVSLGRQIPSTQRAL